MELRYASSEDNPFSNIGGEAVNTNMWPTCLSGHVATGEFTHVSTEARSIGIGVGTEYVLRFAPHNNTYAMSFRVDTGERGLYGHYTWSLANSWRDSLSGGQNTRQAELDLGIIWGGAVNGMCLAVDKHVGTFTSQLGIASFNVFASSS